MNQMRLVLLGASGMVGGYALRYILDHPTIERVTAIGRRKLGVSHPKLHEVLYQDFSDCSALAQAVTGQDTCVVDITIQKRGERGGFVFENRDIRAMVESSDKSRRADPAASTNSDGANQ